LQALRAMGCSKPAGGGGGHGHGHGRGSAAAAAGGSGEAAAQMAYRDANLHLLLQILGTLCRLSAAGRLLGGCPRLSLPEGHGRQLAAALLHLHTDPRVRAAALPQLQEALAALLEAFGDTEWGRVLPDLASQVAAPLGPSHRAALRVLCELPPAGAGGRGAALRRAGALQLLRKLVGKEVRAVGRAAGRHLPAIGWTTCAAAARRPLRGALRCQ
jgi:hypothetical protein